MRRFRFLLALLLAVAAAPAARAAPPVQQKVLPNGLAVLVAEDHAQPLVTVEIAFRNGSMTEPPEYNGVSHLYEHMFFKANQVMPDQEAWLARARTLGLAWNGTTIIERANYFFTTTADHFGEAMAFMRDAIVTPLFDAKELARERVVVTGEIDRNEALPFYHLVVGTQRRVFWKYPSRKDTLGTRATVLAATPEMLRTIQHRYYVPNNGALVVTGDVSAGQVFALAERLYAGWKRGPDPFVKFPLVRHPPLPFTSVVLVQQPVQGVAGRLVWHGPSTVPAEFADTYAADLVSYAVSEPSSRFQRALVDSGACLQADFSWITQRNVGPITAQFQTTPERAADCVRAIRAELDRMKAPDYFGDEELRSAALRAEVDQIRAREQPSELAHTLTFWWASASLDYYAGYVANLRKATRADIAHLLDRWVLGKPFVLGFMTSPESVKAGLDQAALEKLVDARPWPPAGGQAPAKPSKKEGSK